MNFAKRVHAFFYKTENGREPVREWLKEMSLQDKKSIGEDISAVEYLWPIGYPQVSKIDANMWELRSKISDKRISRIFFTIIFDKMILLHGIVKKSQKTPKQDLEFARGRLKKIGEQIYG